MGVSLVTSASFLVLLVLVVVAPRYGVSHWSRGPVLAVVLTALVVLVSAVRRLGPVVQWLERRAVVRRTLMSVALISMVLVQVRVGRAVRFFPGWDAGLMEKDAWGLSHGDLGAHAVARELAAFPNNALLTAALTRWFELLDWSGYHSLDGAIVAANALGMSAAVVLVYLTARRGWSPLAAYVAVLLAGPLVVLSPWIGVGYSDTLGMVFPVAVAYLYVRQRHANLTVRLVLWGGIGVLASLGYQVKPTAVFAACAALAVAVLAKPFRAWTARHAARTAAAAASVVLGSLIGGAVGGAVADGVGIGPGAIADGQAFPFTHFLMMGAQKQPGPYNDYYGVWNFDDVIHTSRTAPADRLSSDWAIYRDRVGDMGIGGYSRFLLEKSVWNFGDGTFFAWGEGDMGVDPTPFDRHDPTSRRIQQFLGFHGQHYGVSVTMWQSTWLIVLALVALPALWWRRSFFTEESAMLGLALLMLLVFLALFEGRARYVYLYLPFFVMLAAATLSALPDREEGRVAAQRFEPESVTVGHRPA